MNEHQCIHKLGLVNRVLFILLNELSHKDCSVHEHILISCRRASFESLSPVRQSLIIAFLLEVLLVK